ncbi:MAG: metal ABC transporter permease [Planctomycetota bacterium]
MTIELWTLAVALITAVTCSVCGVFLVAKREALVSEGLSHAVLPGIIVAFVLLRDRSSPLLILSAAVMGLVMVLLVQGLRRTKLVDDDASLGIVFAALFSIGILLASLELRNVHFHAHCIIDGNLALAPLDAWTVGATSLGPKSFYIMLSVLAVVSAFIWVYFKELKLMVFDPALAQSFRLRPGLLHASWLGLVSLTTVSAFETAGSILVVALMITPPAAAYLLADTLGGMLRWSVLLSALSAVGGFYLGFALDIAPTGPMSALAGGIFLVVLVAAPSRGLLSRWRHRRVQKTALFEHVVLRRVARGESNIGDLCAALAWTPAHLESVSARLCQAGQLNKSGAALQLTDAGRVRLEHELVCP